MDTRLQPDDRRLESPREILPGWILQLPADASGAGVHFGRLPTVSIRPASSVSSRPSPAARSVAGGASTSHSSNGLAAVGIVIVAVLAVAGLAVGLIWRRWAAGYRRRPSHARTLGERQRRRCLDRTQCPWGRPWLGSGRPRLAWGRAGQAWGRAGLGWGRPGLAWFRSSELACWRPALAGRRPTAVAGFRAPGLAR